MTQTTTPAAGASPTATSQTAADQAAAHKGDLLQLVTFHIADEEFGVDILAVQGNHPPHTDHHGAPRGRLH